MPPLDPPPLFGDLAGYAERYAQILPAGAGAAVDPGGDRRLLFHPSGGTGDRDQLADAALIVERRGNNHSDVTWDFALQPGETKNRYLHRALLRAISYNPAAFRP